jgi:hypothetical protein
LQDWGLEWISPKEQATERETKIQTRKASNVELNRMGSSSNKNMSSFKTQLDQDVGRYTHDKASQDEKELQMRIEQLDQALENLF